MIGNRPIIWKTSMWTRQFGVYSSFSSSWTRLFIELTIRQESIIEVCVAIVFGQQRSWSKNRRRSQYCPRLTVTSQCGENHLSCVIELFELWNPKPASFLTRCYVWEASVQNQFKLEKTKFNGIWKHAISKNWIELTEDRWNSTGQNFAGSTTLAILTEIQKIMAELKCEPEQFKGRIIFMSMFHDIFMENSRKWRNLCGEFYKRCNIRQKVSARMLVVSGTWLWEKWYRTHVSKPNGEWNRVAEIMMINFAESGHPIFQATSLLGRGELKSKGDEKGNHSLQRKWRNRWVDSSHGYSCQSAQYLRNSCRFVQRIRSRLCWKWDMWIVGHTDWDCQR